MKNQQLPEPPKQAAYSQPSNPVSHTPAEQRILSARQDQPHSSQFTRQGGKVTRHAGDIDIETVSRNQQSHTPSSSSSYPAAASASATTNNKNDINIGYGVEQQPSEGAIAHAVEGNTRDNTNGNNIKDDSPREHLEGCDGYDEEDDLMAHMGRKRREHDRVLRERMERSLPGTDVESVEREALRRRKREEEERLDVVGAVRRGTGSPVV